MRELLGAELAGKKEDYHSAEYDFLRYKKASFLCLAVVRKWLWSPDCLASCAHFLFGKTKINAGWFIALNHAVKFIPSLLQKKSLELVRN